MIYALLAWSIQGDIEGIYGFLGIVLCITLGFFALVPPRDEIPPIICGFSFLSVLGFPAVQAIMNKRHLAQIDLDAMERVYESLGQKPLNPALRFRLAKLLYARGLVQEAIAVAERTIPSMPVQYFADEHREFKSWHFALKEPKKVTFACFHCHAENLPGEVFCQSCGEPLLLDIARGRWVGNKFLHQMLIIWGAAVSLLIGIPIATLSLPPVWSVVTVLLLVVLAIAGCYFALRPKGEGST
jgi:hypothetical protein